MKYLLLTLLCFTITLNPAFAKGKRVSKNDAVKKVMRLHPGKVLSVKDKNHKKREVYFIKMLTKNGRVKTVKIDANTGKVID